MLYKLIPGTTRQTPVTMRLLLLILLPAVAFAASVEIDNHIVNGADANIAYFPYQVCVLFFKLIMCFVHKRLTNLLWNQICLYDTNTKFVAF